MNKWNQESKISRFHESKNSAGLTDHVDPAIMGLEGKKNSLII